MHTIIDKRGVIIKCMIIKAYNVFLLLSLECLSSGVILFSQNTNVLRSPFSIKNNLKDSTVNTPFGPALKSNVHYIDNNHYLSNKNDTLQIINKTSGKVVQQFSNVLNKDIPTLNDNFVQGSNNIESYSQSVPDEGWITYAECSIKGLNPSTITRYSANWTVPSSPIIESNQLLYLFIGLSTIEDGVAHIVQPVLQWGLSPAGGGKYWAICNWYVSSNFQYFYDTIIQVHTGTQLHGNIELTSSSGNSYNYISSFTGYGPGLIVNNIPRLYDPTLALEAYNVFDCGEYPLDEKLRISDIKVQSSDIIPYFEWYTYKSQNNCNQFTQVVNESLDDGEIYIHFHSPTNIDNYGDFHVYPNPINDFLHISPALRINNCRIEVYNSQGILIHSEFHPSPTYEFDLCFQYYPSGLYIIKFYYNISKTHSFSVIKK